MAEIDLLQSLDPLATGDAELATEAMLTPSPLDDPRYLLAYFVASSQHLRSSRIGKLEWLHYAKTLRTLIPAERRDRIADPKTLEAIGRLLGQLEEQAGLSDAFRVRVRASDVRLMLSLVSEAVRLRNWLEVIQAHDDLVDVRKALRGDPSPDRGFEG